MNIAIVIADSNSACPVPAVKGGAVATLVEHLIEANSTYGKCNFVVFSYDDKVAEERSRQFRNTVFSWVKIPKLIKKIDSMIFCVVTHLFRNKKRISYMHLASLMYYIFSVSKRLQKGKYDKVVLENNIMLSWVMRLNGNMSRYAGKYYYHLHNVPRINGNNRKVFNGVNQYLCVSNYVGKCIQDSNNPIGPVSFDTISIVKNCIDTSKFNIDQYSGSILREVKKEYWIKENEIILMFAGRLSKEKGADQVIKALDYLTDLPVKLLIVGNTLSAEKIEDPFIEELNFLTKQNSNRIVFTGYVKHERMNFLYQISDFTVLPSMWEEPAGLTMIEAMACGTLVITTNSGGIPEYTEKGASIVLERDNELPKKIAETVRYYLIHKDKAAQIAQVGRAFVRENFSMDKYLDNFLNSLKDKET